MKKANWEDNIKELFEERAIEPSLGSWQALSDKLDATEAPKRKPYVWYLGVAASVAGILFVTTLFFNKTTIDTQNPVIVDTQKHIDQQFIEGISAQEEHAVVKSDEKVENTEQIITDEETVKRVKSKDVITSSKRQPSYSNNVKAIRSITPQASKNESETLENIMVSEMVAQIQNMKDNGQSVTEADIDLLLAKAQKAIHYKSVVTENNYAVDANALLKDVESDLQESFRNKIFEALKNSYETVRTAVVERNH